MRWLCANSTRLVDYTDSRRNLYGCLPCPRCLGVHRYPMKDGFIYCDDCGRRQRAVFKDAS